MCWNFSAVHIHFGQFLALRYFVGVFPSMLLFILCFLYARVMLCRLETLLY